MTASRRPRRWDLIVLSLGAISATVSILFWAWLTVWFQLFGEQADRADYLDASGLYAGGLVWLGLASLVAWLAGAPTVAAVVVLAGDGAARGAPGERPARGSRPRPAARPPGQQLRRRPRDRDDLHAVGLAGPGLGGPRPGPAVAHRATCCVGDRHTPFAVCGRPPVSTSIEVKCAWFRRIERGGGTSGWAPARDGVRAGSSASGSTTEQTQSAAPSKPRDTTGPSSVARTLVTPVRQDHNRNAGRAFPPVRPWL